MTTPRLLVGLASVALLAGCLAPDAEPDDVGEAALAATCPDVSGTVIERSLVVTDPEVLAKFSFTRVMTRIRATAGVATTEKNSGIFKRWMRTFGDDSVEGNCGDADVDPNGYGLSCPRAPEAKLGEANPFLVDPLVTFQPVGLFNRLDLAPSTGAHCGEYRIVYAMQSTDPNISGRAFIIFEGILPNPTPSAGLDACLPVAQFWQALSNDDSVTSRAAKLEKFYFTGGAVAGFAPLVNAGAYGFADGASATHGAGQIRTNFFVDFLEWHLREFKLERTCTDPANVATCKLAFDHVTVKTNPAEELFAGSHARSASFVTPFTNQITTSRLAATSLNEIKMTIGDQFNEFESVSQALNADYQLHESTSMATAIQNKLTSIGSTLTANQILRRATTQTCAGCHELSNNDPLGAGLTWPSSNGFTHIDESSNLSPALTAVFLPHRSTVLDSFINSRCDGSTPAPVAAGETLGGSNEGAAN